ncbi:MAG TPA: type II toxin-antitoxin system ParD family antitoxin [Verrucomicrobiae bacterium]|nr:type II toxin-antitoxin system ParD family antitoxin [Verrucomicrobiae bacterium]
MATRNINLTDELDEFVAAQINTGQYQNASEVMRAGLRLLYAQAEERAFKLAALKVAIQEGIDSGPGIPVDDIDAFFAEIDAEIEAEITVEDASARGAAAE